jgi:hypothetical protein
MFSLKKRHHSEEKGLWIYGTLFFILGMLLTVTALYLERQLEDIRINVAKEVQTGAASPPHEGTGQPSWMPPAIIGLKILDHLGLAFISLGTIGVFLESRDWSDYFQRKIAKTITQKDYLKTLGKEELVTLQGNTLKAYFELDDVDREGSLLDYCQKQIHGFLGEPYREDTTAFYQVNHLRGENAYLIEETISYTCRAIKNCIQDEVRWTTEAGEIIKLNEFTIRLEIPENIFKAHGFTDKHPQLKERVVVFDMKDVSEEEKKVTGMFRKLSALLSGDKKGEEPPRLESYEGEGGTGYILKLKAYQDIDKLRISIKIQYTAPFGRSLTWSMTHPSKKVTGIICFPPNTTFSLDTFGVKPTDLHRERRALSFTLKYDSWLLPRSGFTFHLVGQPEDVPPMALLPAMGQKQLPPPATRNSEPR